MRGTRTLRLVLMVVTALLLLRAVPAYSAVGNITTLAIDPLDSNIIYAGTAGGGVFKSTNGGDSWHPAAWPDSHGNQRSGHRSAEPEYALCGDL